MEPGLITNQRPRSDRHAHIRKPQFDCHLLAGRQFSRHNRAHTGFAKVGAASR
jgi:hypothetical protein